MTKKARIHEITSPFLFDPSSVGRSMKKLEMDVIQTSNQEVVSYWYHGENQSAVVVWVDEKKNIIKQQIIYFSQVVEWNILEGIRTGWIAEEEEGLRPNKINKDIKDIHYDQELQKMAISQAIQIIESMDCLEEPVYQALIRNLKESPQISKMSSHEVMTLFGQSYNKKTKLTWWQKLLFLFK
ncbi:MAG: hypothetical protein KDD50_07950 [Bdellovibrionales bacterium]|nr:hypothetical protein [Bdellovibrionales bacterium]